MNRMNHRHVAFAGLAVVLAFVLTSCAPTQVASTAQPGSPGFFYGLWHGFIAPITFVISLFADSVRIYAVPHSGLWYDFGFMLGISGFSGGIFAGSRGK